MKPQWVTTATSRRSGTSAILARNAAQRASRLRQLSITPPHQRSPEPLKSSSGHSRASSAAGVPWSQEKAQRSRTIGSTVIGTPPSSAAMIEAVCSVRR